MDSYDGKKDDKIVGSVWNYFIGSDSGMTAQNRTIAFADAANALRMYLSGLAEKAFKEICERFAIDEIDAKGNINDYNDESGNIVSHSEYDDEGNIVRKTSYFENGKINSVDEYNKDGVRIKRTQYDENGRICSVWEYDKNGKPTKWEKYDENEKLNRTYKYEYDSKGYLSKRKCYYSSGYLNELVIYDRGKLLSQTIYDPEEAGKILTMRYFDENKNCKKEVGYNSDKTKDYETVYNSDGSKNTVYFNDNGTKSYEESYDKDGVLTERKYYDAKGTRIVSTEVYNKETKMWTVTKYDNKGNIVSEETAPMILDGVVGEAAQQGQGDCYLMSSINAIRGVAGGQEYLNSLIKENGDGSYTVTLPGAKIAANSLLAKGIPQDKMYITGEYTFTPEEMKEIRSKEGTGYSHGDDEVKLLEAAFEKYRKEVERTMKENNIEENKYNAGQSTGYYQGKDEDNILLNGRAWDAIFVLTGQKSEIYKSDISPEADYHSFSYSNDNNPANSNSPSFHGGGQPEDNVTADDIDTESNDGHEIKNLTQRRRKLKKLLKKLKNDRKSGNYKYIATCSFISKIDGKNIGHEFTIKTVTDNSVVLINPWYPDKVTKMPINEFIAKVDRVTLAEMPKKAA